MIELKHIHITALKAIEEGVKDSIIYGFPCLKVLSEKGLIELKPTKEHYMGASAYVITQSGKDALKEGKK